MTDSLDPAIRPRVAWLGLGRMGTAMAGRLLDAGFPLAVWNRTPAKADGLIARGATRIERIEDAAESDLIFSMVLDDTALDDLAAALADAPAARRRATAWIDGSTVSVEAAQRAALAAHRAGLAYASAPVSGNPGVVESGRAIFAVSGDEGAIAAVEPVLAALGRATYRVGSEAQANVVKLATNALLAVTMQALAEAAVLADRAGVARRDLLAFVNDSAVGSPFSAYKTPALVGLDFTPAFTAEGQRKDVRLALGLAQDLEVPMPVLAATEVAYSRLIASGLGAGLDLAAVLLQVARDAGIELAAEGD
ncbi:MAG TPA: NAD(P)-dependent oxidoreductase [Amnibacterium sp.]|uniref:NAD(P)-dependent oxidoreductase n=1 Tax=Amnibacterium sp. TaxID=1872496 RepID=UPI002F95A04A